MDHHAGYDPDAEPRFWFVLDVAIAREHALSLAGPPPATVLPELPRELIAAAHHEALAWWSDHDRGQALLAAARAAAWAETGRWLSKGAAAEALIARVDRRLDLLMELHPIGTVESPLTDRARRPSRATRARPRPGWAFDEAVAEGLDGGVGDELLVLTWLDRAAATSCASIRAATPRRRAGVFGTRSPDRPNPIGLHRVTVLASTARASASATSRRSTARRSSTSSRCCGPIDER